MLETTVKVMLEKGLHARPAANFVDLASRFPCDVTIQKNDKSANAKSILGVLSLAVTPGSQIVLRTDGQCEEDALVALCEYLEGNAG